VVGRGFFVFSTFFFPTITDGAFDGTAVTYSRADFGFEALSFNSAPRAGGPQFPPEEIKKHKDPATSAPRFLQHLTNAFPRTMLFVCLGGRWKFL